MKISKTDNASKSTAKIFEVKSPLKTAYRYRLLRLKLVMHVECFHPSLQSGLWDKIVRIKNL